MKIFLIILFQLLLLPATSLCSVGQVLAETTFSAEMQSTVRPNTFPNDSVLLDYIQKAHLNYMWDGAEPNSGLAPERIHLDGVYPENDAHIVTTGGSGFGIAGLLVGIDRGFINRKEGVKRLQRVPFVFCQRPIAFMACGPIGLMAVRVRPNLLGRKTMGAIWLKVRS